MLLFLWSDATQKLKGLVSSCLPTIQSPFFHGRNFFILFEKLGKPQTFPEKKYLVCGILRNC